MRETAASRRRSGVTEGDDGNRGVPAGLRRALVLLHNPKDFMRVLVGGEQRAAFAYGACGEPSLALCAASAAGKKVL